jgi:STE24 endopeptidase
MIAVILLSVATLLVGLELHWHGPDWPIAVKLVGVAALTLANLLAAALLMKPCIPHDDDPQCRVRRIVHYAYLRPMLPAIALVTLQAQVWLLGWPLLAQRFVSLSDTAPSLFVLAGLLPVVVGVVLAWVPMYLAERELRATPISMGQYLLYRFRTQVLFVLAPLAVIIAASDLVDYLAWQYPRWQGEIVMGGGLGVFAVAVFLFPLAVRFIWPTRPMPAGEVRSMLEDLCRKTGVGVREILLWRTPGRAVTNAAVLGFVAPMRFILVTDGLINAMTVGEQQAVFAHELGHVRKHHIPYLAMLVVVFLGLIELLSGVVPMPEWAIGPSGVTGGEGLWGLVAAAVAAGLYWGLVFGFVSRRFERQADLYCIEMGFDAEQLIAAFEKIATLSGMPSTIRSWRHFSLARRIEFLRRVQEDHAVAEAFTRRVKLLKAAMVVGAAGAVWVLWG